MNRELLVAIKGTCFLGYLRGGMARLFVLAVFLLDILFSANAEASAHKNIVIHQKGNWQVLCPPTGNPIAAKEGLEIEPGSRIRPKDPGKASDVITVFLRDGNCLTCTGDNFIKCDRPLGKLPDDVEFGDYFDAIVDLFTGKTVSPESSSARGLKKNGLSEAVIRVENGRLNISPIFKREIAGQYTVSFKAVLKGTSSPGVENVQVDWSGQRTAAIEKWKNFNPGIYEIEVHDITGKKSGDKAWILLSPKAGYRNANEKFETLRTRVQSWNDQEAAKRVLRLYLIVLSEKLLKK